MNKKAVKKKAVKKKKDTGMGELLGLLRTRPHLVHALIFDHGKVTRLLRSNEARRLIPGVDARRTLQNHVAKGHHGGSIGIVGCIKRSR